MSKSRKIFAVRAIVVLMLAIIVAFGWYFFANYKMYVIHTGSMQRTIPSRSLVIVRTGPVKVGEVISFHHDNGVVTHRLIKINPDGTYVTKGDSNPTPDAVPTAPDRVIGHVVAAPRNVGYWLYDLRAVHGYGPFCLGAGALICLFLAVTDKEPTKGATPEESVAEQSSDEPHRPSPRPANRPLPSGRTTALH